MERINKSDTLVVIEELYVPVQSKYTMNLYVHIHPRKFALLTRAAEHYSASCLAVCFLLLVPILYN